MANSTNEDFKDVLFEDVIGDRFGRYSKYIIQDRALPDARDGLKPVQRRILYAMHVEGNTSEKAFRKSAKTVGNVIGNYHPHGDSSVYEAMVRMSQEWKLRNELIQMHGNNGSLDGDPPAAMRYTEARLSAIAGELLRDIDKRTVDFAPNFDDTSKEPVVLPASFPNLLVNGSTGISAGYATEIPSHNLAEVIDATVMRIENKNVSIDELMTVLHGPDFPTGGIIQGVDGIKKAYETGKGKIIIRALTEIETLKGGKEQIAITELPYDVNKANLVKRIDDIRAEKKIEGIAEVRDETDRTGLRIVIELKKEADSKLILNYLLKNTDLQVAYNFNMVAINNRRPEQMSLPALLDAYIHHRREVVTKRSRHELDKAKERSHIVEGLIKALSILDEVIAAIRASLDKKDARENLMKKFGFTEIQAEAIVTLQLYRLTNTDITALQAEAEELKTKIAELVSILMNDNKLMSVIKKELLDVKKQFTSPRRSKIEDEIVEIKISQEQLIVSEDVIVSVTKEGYIKRTSQRSFAASNGDSAGMKDGDRLMWFRAMNTLHTVLLFTDKGNYLYVPVHQLPVIAWKEIGQHVNNIVQMGSDEKIISVIPVIDFDQPVYLTFITKNGLVKRSELNQYKAQRISKPITAIGLKKNDSVIDVFVTDGFQFVFLVSNHGYGLIFNEDEVPCVGSKAAGVIGMKLKDGDYVVGGQAVHELKGHVVSIITQRSSVKKMKLTEFEVASRAKRGLIMLRDLKTNPHRVVGIHFIAENDAIFVKAEKGEIVEIPSESIRMSDRYTNGSLYLDEDESGVIVDTWIEKGNEK
ncbi:MAG: parC [Bacillales bacterium]|jgi:topoisomerase-4 subunit A|nr:parC [Bacillales bacterium]